MLVLLGWGIGIAVVELARAHPAVQGERRNLGAVVLPQRGVPTVVEVAFEGRREPPSHVEGGGRMRQVVPRGAAACKRERQEQAERRTEKREYGVMCRPPGSAPADQ